MLEWLGDIGTELERAFRSEFGVEPRPFGSPALAISGVSDGAQGVQWNLGFDRDTSSRILGVNLEGMKYGSWPIASFIFNELRTPRLLSLSGLDSDEFPVTVSFRRDYWQASARPPILERALGATPCRLRDLTEPAWRTTLCDALGCLDHERSRAGRAKQTVTFVDGRRITGDVSPHLQVLLHSENSGSWATFVGKGRSHLQPLYDLLVEQTSTDVV